MGVSISETQLIEIEQTETTLTFTLSEPPPEEGLTVLLDSDNDTTIGSVLSQFDVLNADVAGGDFPIANADRSGFFFNITEQTATITLAVFDELTVDAGVPPDTFQEGILDLTFTLEPQLNYTIDPEASEINLTISDNPDSQIFVTPTAAGSIDLFESEGTVGLLNLSLGAPPTASGLTVSPSTDALADFDTEAIEVDGGTIAAVRDNGLDITLTEREASVRLPILDDGIDEGSETATFTVEPGDGYETAQAIAEVTFFLGDTLGQASSPEEIEGNSTLPVANSLGLSANNPVVSIRGGLSGLDPESGGNNWLGYSEDVDFYSFTLAAGQTVALDIDGRDDFPSFSAYPDVYILPESQDIPQIVDTELRLFDAAGNELFANNDGAAPGEEFSRDPYLEFTAETAGTYYVGVSALGNRTYDPFVQFSGSAWTFPEVGVFFGDYDLTATLTDSASASIGIGLYDADTDTLIATLNEGTEVLASEILGKDITIAALVPDDSTFSGQVESMVLNLNQGQFTRTESVAPYALFSDRNGDFRGQDAVLAVGSNDITFDLYAENRGQGELLASISQSFTVVDDITGIIGLSVGLYDADTDTLITPLSDGDTVLASDIADRNVTIAAFLPNDDLASGLVESLVLNLNQGQVVKTENIEPYALFGDSNGDFRGGGGGVLSPGSNSIGFELYSENRGQGDLLQSETLTFTVV